MISNLLGKSQKLKEVKKTVIPKIEQSVMIDTSKQDYFEIVDKKHMPALQLPIELPVTIKADDIVKSLEMKIINNIDKNLNIVEYVIEENRKLTFIYDIDMISQYLAIMPNLESYDLIYTIRSKNYIQTPISLYSILQIKDPYITDITGLSFIVYDAKIVKSGFSIMLYDITEFYNALDKKDSKDSILISIIDLIQTYEYGKLKMIRIDGVWLLCQYIKLLKKDIEIDTNEY